MSIQLWLLAVPAIAAGAAVAPAPRARWALGTAAALVAFAVASGAVGAGVSLDAPLDRASIEALPPAVRLVCGLLVAVALALIGLAVLGPRGASAVPAAAPPAVPQPARSDRIWAALVLLGALLAIVGPHLSLVAGGALLAAVASHVVAHRWRAVVAFPLLPLLVAIGLGVVLYYADVIAGPVGLATDTLRDIPFSPSAAAMLAPFLALGAIGFFGIAPRRLVPGAALAGIGVALVVRIGNVALRDGLTDWRTVLVPLGVLALWHAAITRRPAPVVAALAWLGAVAVSRAGAPGAIWLAGAAALTALLVGSRPLVARHPIARAAAGAMAGWGGGLVFDALLRAEVVYAVIAWAAVLVALWRIARTPSGIGPPAAG